MSKKQLNKSEPIALIAERGEIQAMTPVQAAMASGASPTELLQFMELQERFEANEARKAFVMAMSKFRADCPTILKTESAHNSKYASIAKTLGQIKQIMSDNGLSHSWRTNQEGANITVTCVLTHSQGHSESTSLTAAPDTSGSKNAIQAIGSTVKYLERYTLEACLGLASSEEGDDDGQAAGHMAERISEDQALTLHSMLTENEVDVAKFERWLMGELKCAGINDISVNAYDYVVTQAKAAIERKANANS